MVIESTCVAHRKYFRFLGSFLRFVDTVHYLKITISPDFVTQKIRIL